jgi:hypothetical protein
MAGYYPESLFVADVPQIALEDYFRGERKEDYKQLFNIKGILPTVFDFWPDDAVLPRYIYYLQNKSDHFHIRTQCSYFMNRVSEMIRLSSLSAQPIAYCFYEDPLAKRGHSPLPQDRTIKLLSNLAEETFCIDI